jgi:protein phosphatase
MMMPNFLTDTSHKHVEAGKRFSVAILADVHGNADALQAVLEDLRANPTDRVVLGGDLVMNGAKPAEALRLLRDLGAPGVVGNTDLYVLNGIDSMATWVQTHLKEDDLAYLAALPVSLRVTPPGGRSPDDDLMVVHSTPRDPDDLLILEVHPFGTSFTETTPPEQAQKMLCNERANLIVYGHIHYFSVGIVDDIRMASVGSVGFPFDHDPRAAYGVATWDGQNWALEPRRLAYNHKQTAAEIEQSDMPFSSSMARRIREADWFAREP